jgi:hypothetical protein
MPGFRPDWSLRSTETRGCHRSIGTASPPGSRAGLEPLNGRGAAVIRYKSTGDVGFGRDSVRFGDRLLNSRTHARTCGRGHHAGLPANEIVVPRRRQGDSVSQASGGDLTSSAPAIRLRPVSCRAFGARMGFAIAPRAYARGYSGDGASRLAPGRPACHSRQGRASRGPEGRQAIVDRSDPPYHGLTAAAIP